MPISGLNENEYGRQDNSGPKNEQHSRDGKCTIGKCRPKQTRIVITVVSVIIIIFVSSDICSIQDHIPYIPEPHLATSAHTALCTHIPGIADICAFQSYQMSHLFIPRIPQARSRPRPPPSEHMGLSLSHQCDFVISSSH